MSRTAATPRPADSSRRSPPGPPATRDRPLAATRPRLPRDRRSHGIGRATVLRLAAEGATVIAADLDLAGARETAALAAPPARDRASVRRPLRALGGRVRGARRARHPGRLDLLVNNAGIEILGSIEETTPTPGTW